MDNGEPRCIHFGGTPVDDAIQTQVIEVLRPAALEAALCGAQTQIDRGTQVLEALELELKSARYTAERAQQQFDAVDPKNRLVADELERRWNQALERHRELEDKLQQERSNHSVPTLPSLDEMVGLAKDLDLLWHHSETDMRLKKRILRTLIEEILADVDPNAGVVQLVVHWKGGLHTELTVARRKRGQNRRHLASDTAEAISTLARVLPDSTIAGCLTKAGLRTGTGNFWTKEAVAAARNHREIPRHSPERQRTEGWMTLTQAAAFLGIAAKSLRRAAEGKEVSALHPLADGPWIFKRCDLETAAAKQLTDRMKSRFRKGAAPNAGQLPLDISTT